MNVRAAGRQIPRSETNWYFVTKCPPPTQFWWVHCEATRIVNYIPWLLTTFTLPHHRITLTPEICHHSSSAFTGQNHRGLPPTLFYVQSRNPYCHYMDGVEGIKAPKSMQCGRLLTCRCRGWRWRPARCTRWPGGGGCAGWPAGRWSSGAAAQPPRTRASARAAAAARSPGARRRGCRAAAARRAPAAETECKNVYIFAPCPGLTADLSSGRGGVADELVRAVVGEPGDAGPAVLGGGAHHAEDLVQLVPRVPHPGEGRVAQQHLHEDAAGAPHVQAGGVVGAPQQHVRWPVPAPHSQQWRAEFYERSLYGCGGPPRSPKSNLRVAHHSSDTKMILLKVPPWRHPGDSLMWW